MFDKLPLEFDPLELYKIYNYVIITPQNIVKEIKWGINGTNVLQQEIHVLNMEDLSEISMQDPIEAINKRMTSMKISKFIQQKN